MISEDRYDSLFRWYGSRNGVDWTLLKAQVKAESNFDPDALSPVGAKGLSQFMDRTWAEWQDGIIGITDPPPDKHFNQFDPEDAIRAQAAMMAWLLRVTSNSVVKALAAYNFGIGHVLRGDPWPAETLAYVDRIQRFHKAYMA